MSISKAVLCCREQFQKSGVCDRQGVIESFKKNPLFGYIGCFILLNGRKNVFGKLEDRRPLVYRPLTELIL